MASALKQIIGQFEAMEKKALAKIAEDPMGNENSAELTGVPGAEHDVNVPASAKEPDPEVAQGQPADAASTEGAVPGGDAKPLEEGKLEVDEAVLNPDQKPMTTDEAYAKEASAKVDSLVEDILNSISAPAQKQAATQAQSERGSAKVELNEDMIAKLAEAVAVYNRGVEAGEKVAAAAAQERADEQQGILDACTIFKTAQDNGVSPEETMAALTAGAPAAEEAAPDAAAAAAEEAPAIPEDVTREELGEAIVDLVDSGELDPDVAKAIVAEIASADQEAPTEEEAAQIVADGLANGTITEEQAQEIAAAIDGDSAAPAEVDDAAAAGAAAADAAAADAADELEGVKLAEAAFSMARKEAERARGESLAKIASAISAKRNGSAKSGFMAKVAEKLSAKKENDAADRFAAAFTKRAQEIGVDPKGLAQYALSMKNK